MAESEAEMRLKVVRESLEGMLSPEVVSAVLFEALEPYGGDLPSEPDALLEFVRGPMQGAIAERVGEAAADDVRQRIETVLGTQPTQPAAQDAEPSSGRQSVNDRVTARVQVHQGPTRMVVAAAGNAMARRLRAALGPRGTSFAVPDAARLEVVANDFKPSLLLIDATDPIDADPGHVASLLGSLPESVLVVVWGSREPAAGPLLEALEERGVRATSLDRDEGVEPLLDLVRSRQKAR